MMGLCGKSRTNLFLLLTFMLFCGIIYTNKGGDVMNLYIFSNHRDKISREEVNVIEKNTYFEKVGSAPKTRYKKSDLDVIEDDGKYIQMISLSGRPDKFIEKVIECKKQRVSELQKKTVAEQNSIIAIKNKFNYVFVSNIDGDEYISKDFLNCSANEQNIKGVIQETGYQKHKIGVLMSGDDFVIALENDDSIAEYDIKNIFVDGKNTNLSINGYKKVAKDTCFINVYKLKDLCNKSKVEVNLI